MNNNHYVAIMAGGIGSRFWPASRTNTPKQFLDILGVGKSLIRLTFERFLKLCPAENIFIVTNEIYKNLVKEHLPEISENQILCEPSRNNTAPCVAYTSFKLHSLNPEANFVVAPSDHIILKEDAFIKKIEQALDFAENNEALVTLGIEPSRPDTGYGYINFEKGGENNVNKVRKFTEKPPHEKAVEYLASGDYLWNAGIFVWKAKTILKAFQNNAPSIYEILEAGYPYYNTTSEQEFINENYPKTPSISVDYAIMEKSDNIYTIPSEIGWSDLGTWGSLYAEIDKDEHGNVVNSDRVMLENASNNLIRVPKDKLVVLRDLEDYIIIDEEDVLLVYPKAKEQEIKALTGKVKEEFGDLFS